MMLMTVLAATWLSVLPGDEVVDSSELSTGFAGSFFVVLGLAVAVALLGFDMVRRLRRSRFRSEIQADLQAELAERDSAVEGSDPRPANN